jgi:hypothetical protein
MYTSPFELSAIVSGAWAVPMAFFALHIRHGRLVTNAFCNIQVANIGALGLVFTQQHP